ncbi:HdeD family acid-resistance protein [Inquilinus sp. NPDC058860]|uniref:HdeD family acid-resistance protein n=1 Tax=Inquilinus sp. NPDC058860 TaxID=3346652 RepID=UPI0036958D73
MVRLALLLLGADAVRRHWRSFAAFGLAWGALGIGIFVDGLDNVPYFPIHTFAYLLLVDAAIALLLAPVGLGAQKWLRLVRGLSLVVISLLILDTHRASNIILAMLFGLGLVLDAGLRIASAIVVRFPGWRLVIAAAVVELLLAVFVLEPWPTWYAGTVELCVSIALMLSAWAILRLALRMRRLPEHVLLPQLLTRGGVGIAVPAADPGHDSVEPTGPLIVHVWTPFGSAKEPIHRPIIDRYIAAVDGKGVISTGHSALEMPPDLYISHYPAVEIDHSPDEFGRILRATAENDVPGRFQPSYAEEAAGWCESNTKVVFRDYDPARLRAFWDGYSRDNTYNLTNRNCSSTVAHALEVALEGVLGRRRSRMAVLRMIVSSELWIASQLRRRAETMAWTPGLVLDYARALNGIVHPPPAPWQVLGRASRHLSRRLWPRHPKASRSRADAGPADLEG